jgi:hypothetical protein
VPLRSGHWAVGWVEGYAIRVFRKSRPGITKAFQTWCQLQARLENYPMLDEEDYSRREFEATLENIEQQADRIAGKYDIDIDLPEDYVSQLHAWFDAHDSRALESRDDQGGYPSDQQTEQAMVGLGWLIECDQCADMAPHEHCDLCGEPFQHKPFINPVSERRFCSLHCYVEGYDN